MKHAEAQGDDVRPDPGQRAAVRAAVGVLAAGLGCLLAVYGAFRLGIGRHGEPWWRPFGNALTPSHVENLAMFAVGIAGIAIGAWLAISAVTRARRRG